MYIICIDFSNIDNVLLSIIDIYNSIDKSYKKLSRLDGKTLTKTESLRKLLGMLSDDRLHNRVLFYLLLKIETVDNQSN